jgi:hypothetical protein
MSRGKIYGIIQSVEPFSGVYMIMHEPTSRIYIGFSNNVDEGARHRVAQHFDDLVRNRHSCPRLQQAWNEDSNPDNWTAELLEKTTIPSSERAFMNAFSIPNDYDFNKKRCLR